MTNLYINEIHNNKYNNNIKQIIHKNKTYYQLVIKGNIDTYDKVYFETSPYKCNKCDVFFNIYKEIYVNYLYILKKKLNSYIITRIISKLKKFRHIKHESDLIGTHTHWYIHICHRCI